MYRKESRNSHCKHCVETLRLFCRVTGIPGPLRAYQAAQRESTYMWTVRGQFLNFRQEVAMDTAADYWTANRVCSKEMNIFLVQGILRL